MNAQKRTKWQVALVLFALTVLILFAGIVDSVAAEDLPPPELRLVCPAVTTEQYMPVYVYLDTNGHTDLNSMVFSLDYDPYLIAFGPHELYAPTGYVANLDIQFWDQDGEIDVVVFNPVPGDTYLQNGVIAWLLFNTRPWENSTTIDFSLDPIVSFGRATGQSAYGYGISPCEARTFPDNSNQIIHVPLVGR